MRIVELLLRPGLGGAETLVDQLASQWRNEGHDVVVVFVDPDGPQGRIERLRRLARSLDALAPDVVHAHSALPNIYARIVCRRRRPVVTVLHGAGNDFEDPVLRYAEWALGRWTSHVVAVSPSQAEAYRATTATTVPVTVIPNGVRRDLSPRRVPSPRLSRVVALSRLDPQKRLDVLLDGWTEAALTGVSLRVGGRSTWPETQADVEARAARSASTELVGPVSEVPSFLAAADLFVHTADREAHPLAPLEAACSGLPLVVSEAVAATLPPGLAVVSFPTGDAAGLARALHSAADSYADLAERAVARAPTIADETSLEICAARHLQVLHEAVTSAGR